MNQDEAVKPGARDAQLLAEILAADACRELLLAQGCEIEEAELDALEPVALCAVIGFSGEALRGSLMLGMSPRAVEAVGATAGDLLRDLLGELSNQLLGRIKNKLLAYGVELSSTVPVVLRGHHFAPVSRTELHAVRLGLRGGSVWVWIDVDCFDGFEMRLQPAESPNALTEGDILLF